MSKFFVVTDNATVYTATSQTNATNIAAAVNGYAATDDALSAVPAPLLVKLYNRARPERPVTRFADRATGEKRIAGVMELLAVPAPAAVADALTAAKAANSEEDPMARTATKKAAKKAPAKKAAKEDGAPRASKNNDKLITKITVDNPHREGGINFEGWKLVREGMTVRKFVENGGSRALLGWWVANGHLKLKNA